LKVESRELLNSILISLKDNRISKEQKETIFGIIPELKNMDGFEHKHPHHCYDVWNHTLAVINNIEEQDLELIMAALLHDIGKPFSYQDEEVRHFHGHPEVSEQMARKILERLKYDQGFIQKVCYLVRTHDNKIDINFLDNSYDMIKKRLKLQYADAKAHAPNTVQKRINLLDKIKEDLERIREEER